jgi:hypothetical protein
VLGKLYNALAIVSIATMLAVGAVAGLLLGSGRLTTQRLERIAQVIRGELDELPQPTETAEPAAAADEPDEKQVYQAASDEEIRQQRRDEQLRRALGERAYRDLVAQRQLLDQTLQHLITAEERFEESRTAWQTELERRLGAARDEGFEKELQFVAKLPPKQAKEHLVRKWKEHPADATYLLSALPVSTGKRILEQLKTPEEMQIMHELLERLGKQTATPLETGSGTTAGS